MGFRIVPGASARTQETADIPKRAGGEKAGICSWMICTTIQDMQGIRAPRDHDLALYRTRSWVGLETLYESVTWGIHRPLIPDHPYPAETGSRDRE